jgi:phage replication O-like protein O
MKITAPNYTQTPNDLFDYWLPHLKEGELKVLLVIMRKTFGWHKKRDRISISQLMRLTGLSKPSVIDASKSLQDKGII